MTVKSAALARPRGPAAELYRSVDEALAKLRAARLTDHRVHRARRSLKRARAALRLLRPTISDRQYRLENLTLRDASRLLSPLRDARAQLQTFERLQSRYPASLAGRDLSSVRLFLEHKLVDARRGLRGPSGSITQCVSLLRAHQQRWQERGMDLAPADFDALRRIYRRGRKAVARAAELGTAEALHDWRKHVKYLLNGLEILQPGCSSRADKILLRTDALGDLLGEDHDLAVLQDNLSDRALTGLPTDARKALLRVIDRRRTRLKARALAQGKRLYCRKAKAFVRRLVEHPSPRRPSVSARPADSINDTVAPSASS